MAMGGLLSRAARQGGYPTRPCGAYTRLHPRTPSSQPCWGASLGALSHDTFSRLCVGLPCDQLDLPIIPPEHLTRPLARRLRDLGLHLWGDLTYQSSGSRAWIPVDAFHRLRLPIPYPSSPCPQQPYVNCHGGQFWALRSSPGLPGGIYEILNLPSNPAADSAVLYYRRWVGMSYSRRGFSDRIYLSPGHKIQPLSPLTGGAISWDHYLTMDCFRKQAHARLLTCTHSRPTRILLHTFWEPPSLVDPPSYSPAIQEALLPNLETSDSWDVYADGSWYPAQSSAESLLGEAASHTGGCSLIFAPTTSHLSKGVTVLRVDARALTRVHGGGPRMMELVGVTSSIILLHALGKRGCVYTDNQGIVKQLTDHRRLRRTGLMGGSALALQAWDILREGQISLRWHRGHPERREKDRTLWSREDWGIYLANCWAPPRAHPLPSSCPSIPILHTILTDITGVRQQLASYSTWSFRGHQDDITLGPLPARQLLARSRNYRRIRDEYRTSRGAPPKWRTTSPQWASYIWALPATTLKRRGTLLRTIWDQWWHGENQLVAGSEDGLCPLCQGTVYSQAHILCECPHLEPYRTEQLSSIHGATRRIPAGPQRALIQHFVHIARHWNPVEERVLLWTGMLNKPQRTSLQPFLVSLPTFLGRSLLKGTGRSFARATRTLWDLFRSQVASTASPSPLLNPCPALDSDDPASSDWDPTLPVEHWQSTSSLRLREEGDYG